MEGVYEREGVWYCDFRVDGRRYRRSLRTKDELVAKHRAREFLRAKTLGTYAPEDLDLMQQAEGAWADHVAREAASGWVYKLYKAARDGAPRRGLQFNLTMADMVEITQRCAGFCEVTGAPLIRARVGSARTEPFAPSLDRRDASKGYTKSNCRIVCYLANLAMGQWGEAPFKTALTYYAKQI